MLKCAAQSDAIPSDKLPRTSTGGAVPIVLSLAMVSMWPFNALQFITSFHLPTELHVASLSCLCFPLSFFYPFLLEIFMDTSMFICFSSSFSYPIFGEIFMDTSIFPLSPLHFPITKSIIFCAFLEGYSAYSILNYFGYKIDTLK